MTYTKEEMASLLDGRAMGKEISRDEEKIARDSGLVVVFGYSDDNAEFRGSIRDGLSCIEDTILNIDYSNLRVLPPHDDCECNFCGYQQAVKSCHQIKVQWDKDGYSWTYETTIPHACFDILEDGEKFCRGIVFSVNDLPEI